ncbi:MAG: SusE domain-containing protein [Bacteroidales bacterium]|jgi:hypothetical protein|nr:SusE domain-containing protein [Bacteroidales bacterium]
MKNIIYLLLLLIMVAFGCKKEEKTTALSNPTPPVLTSQVAAIEITPSNSDSVLTFHWTPADFGYSAAITYRLYASVLQGQQGQQAQLGDPAPVGVPASEDSMSVVLGDLNAVLLSLGAQAEVPTSVQFTLEAAISQDYYIKVLSSPVSITVTPYSSVPPALHIVGSAFDDIAGFGTAGNYCWDVANYRYVMFRDDNLGLNVYTSSFLANSEFQLFPDASLGSWAKPAYGYDWEAGEGHLMIPAASYGNIQVHNTVGYYTLEVDILNLTFSFSQYDVSSATVYSTMSISGDFNEWANLNMKQTHYDPHIWYLDSLDISTGGVKFNADETTSYSASGFPYGKGDANGSNIPVTTGKYFVKFNDLTKHYVFYKHK